MSRESLGTGAAPVADVIRMTTQQPQGETPPEGGGVDFCRVIVVTESPQGSLNKPAGTVAVLNAEPGAETKAPGVWYQPSGGVNWVKLAPILEMSAPPAQLEPGTFVIDEYGALWIYVDRTTSAVVPLTWLKELYQHKERLRDLWGAQPGSLETFDQELDPMHPLTTGHAGRTLDSVVFPQRVGDRYVSTDGKRAYERWGWQEVSESSPHSVLWRPLHREIAQNTTMGAVSEMNSPDLMLWKTGPCKIILRGHLAQVGGSFALRMALNPDNDVHAGHFQTYRWSKHTRRATTSGTNGAPGVGLASEGVAVKTVADNENFYAVPYGLLANETEASHDTFGAGAGNPPAWFYLEMDLPDPRQGNNFLPIHWQMWTSSVVYDQGLPVGNQFAAVHTEGHAMVWDPDHEADPNYLFEIRRIGFHTMREGEGGFDKVAAFGLDVEMEVRW